MIGNINLSNMNPSNGTGNKKYSAPNQLHKNLPFGYEEGYQSHFQPLKDWIVMITDDAVGIIGMNAALWGLQRFVNGKILVGKINKHFTKDIKDVRKLDYLADEMLYKHGLLEKVEQFIGPNGQAFFDHSKNIIVTGKDQYSSLFHEIGHAMIENKTVLLKKLQRFRGHYSILSLALYALLSQRPKQNDDDQSFGSIINKSDVVVSLLAFSPELITEAKASQEGLKFLKQKLSDGIIEKSLYKNIKKSYITCFATYLFIPVSIILIDMLRNSANNARRKRIMRQNEFYY